MKTLLTLGLATLLLAVSVSVYFLVRPAASASTRPVPPKAPVPAAPTVRRLAQSTEAGHVADVLVWSNIRVVKGQPLARLSIPVVTPALRAAKQAVAVTAAAYAAQPNAENARALQAARAQLHAVPLLVRDAYVVAPATGRLVRSLVTNGQYLPRAGAVAIIEVPVEAAADAAKDAVVMR